jgi:hypothetical protein
MSPQLKRSGLALHGIHFLDAEGEAADHFLM